MKDGVLQLKQLEDALIQDDDDRVEMPPPFDPLVPSFYASTPTAGASSSSIPLPPSSSFPSHGDSRIVRGGRRID